MARPNKVWLVVGLSLVVVVGVPVEGVASHGDEETVTHQVQVSTVVGHAPVITSDLPSDWGCSWSLVFGSLPGYTLSGNAPYVWAYCFGGGPVTCQHPEVSIGVTGASGSVEGGGGCSSGPSVSCSTPPIPLGDLTASCSEAAPQGSSSGDTTQLVCCSQASDGFTWATQVRGQTTCRFALS